MNKFVQSVSSKIGQQATRAMSSNAKKNIVVVDGGR
jgi:hypothetical protein